MSEGAAPAAVAFRPARAADLPAIVALLADDPWARGREAPGEPLDPAYARAFEAIEASAHVELIVAEMGGRVVGCAQLAVTPGLSLRGLTRAEVEGVRVASELRGRGIGEAMLRHALDRARARGCGLVQLTSNRARADALRFYRRLGFEAEHVGLKLRLGPGALAIGDRDG